MTMKKFNQDEMRAYNEAFDCFDAFMWGAQQESNPYRRGTGKLMNFPTISASKPTNMTRSQ